MVNSVCFCVLLLTVPVLMRPDTDWDVNGIDVTDYLARNRIKREVWRLTGALIRNARLIMARKSLERFAKAGGQKQAEKDFQSLKPTGVHEVSGTKFGDVDGDLVSLKLLSQYPRLSIHSRQINPDGRPEWKSRQILYKE